MVNKIGFQFDLIRFRKRFLGVRTAVRGEDASRGTIHDCPKTPRTITALWYRGVQGGPSIAPPSCREAHVSQRQQRKLFPVRRFFHATVKVKKNRHRSDEPLATPVLLLITVLCNYLLRNYNIVVLLLLITLLQYCGITYYGIAVLWYYLLWYYLLMYYSIVVLQYCGITYSAGYVSAPPFGRWTFRRRDYRAPELFF